MGESVLALRLASFIAGIGLLVGCAGPAGPAGSGSSSPVEPGSPSPTAAGPALVVDGPVAVMSDRELLVRCYGIGAPTILLEAGGTTSDLTNWPTAFMQTLAETNTTCAYSRAGGNGSTPVAGLLSRKVIVHDAFALLERLHQRYGVSGPYLLVGWSFGGSVILAEALEHPELTAGLVALDTGFPVDYMKVCTASGRPGRECRKWYDEDKEAKSIEKDIAARVHPLPDIPITEVSAMHLDDCSTVPRKDLVSSEAAGVVVTAPDCEALATKIAEKNFRDWRQLGPQVRELRVQASHDGLISEAGLEIIKIIKGILRR
jgi:pimeloyl-ACP methyl ester carboxylesterase